MTSMCSTSCPTKDHASWGECIRSKGLQVAPIANVGAAKAWDRELDEYRAARRQGVQPSGTTTKQTRDAMEISERTGKPFQADNVMGSLT